MITVSARDGTNMNISGQAIDVTDQWAANNSASGFLVGKITQLFSLLDKARTFT